MTLTESELDSLLVELGPQIDTDAHRMEPGLGVYPILFKAHPEYVSKFRGLVGCTVDNVMTSKGIKFYALALVNQFVAILSMAAESESLEAAIVQAGLEYIDRDVTPSVFKGGEKLFIDYFNTILAKPENKASMEKFLKLIFPGIAAHF